MLIESDDLKNFFNLIVERSIEIQSTVPKSDDYKEGYLDALRAAIINLDLYTDAITKEPPKNG